ncbi:uncharacterized protein LOC116719226 [Xiphophorus hellerii]|uniref:uncharacterized protein LOC116719122 n=1 Tax=Xiphophorus hellerii TaxID=8084 RepID=UPI0013B46647|nr:uncharacterized protein LOC116719122 [Xiphophorus hellerii]XP_032417406.1 uncharacterized protein LOC116719122 [Xiphophorus hellerii]XP_032417600.1 uncharacterized protein LOC116719226 [Xiphophorus hellerii]XP_032417601.1 uncharacterized protein LOC116719226 [Xiphophorus hellerii]
MAAVGAEATGSWFLTPEVFLLLILIILLSIFLTTLCSDCNRNSFELQDSKTEKPPSALIRVVKLEEVKENPMIGEIQKDEREFSPGGDPAEPVSSSEGQQGELQSRPDLKGSAPRTCDHVRDGRGHGSEPLGPTANRLSTQLHYVTQSDERNTVYARVSKKLRLANSPVPTPGGAGPPRGEEPEDQRSPPRPDRETWREDGAE